MNTLTKEKKPKLTAFLGIRLDSDLHEFVMQEALKETKGNVNKYVRKILEKEQSEQS